jgi:hypothetical protein
MFRFFAQLNSELEVVAVSNLSFGVGADIPKNLVEITEQQYDDKTLLTKKYSENTKKFRNFTPDVPPIRTITKGAFYERLPMSLLLAIESKTVPLLNIFYNKLNFRDSVDLDDKKFIAGIGQIVNAKLLTTEQVTELRKDGESHEAA